MSFLVSVSCMIIPSFSFKAQNHMSLNLSVIPSQIWPVLFSKNSLFFSTRNSEKWDWCFSQNSHRLFFGNEIWFSGKKWYLWSKFVNCSGKKICEGIAVFTKIIAGKNWNLGKKFRTRVRNFETTIGKKICEGRQCLRKLFPTHAYFSNFCNRNLGFRN